MTNNLNSNKFKCCGCGLCEHICPKKAITMCEDEEGFLSYKIDKDKCINCGICKNKCPQLNNLNVKESQKQVYAAYTTNITHILTSASGGIFQELANNFLKHEKTAVIGSYLDDENVAKHICITKIDELYKLAGSKYVQSDTRGIYKLTKDLLDKQYSVLFSGTACQIAALKFSINSQKYDNLYTIEIICHGVPSPLLFKKYIKWLEDKRKGKVKKYIFRSKKDSKHKLSSPYVSSYEINNKRYYKVGTLDPYYLSFINETTYRESCYECKYANDKRVSDITIGDYWGIEKVHPKFANKLGTSSIIINTEKGKEFFESNKKNIKYIESAYRDIIKGNTNLLRPTKRPILRDKVYKGIMEKSFEDIIHDNLEYHFSIKQFILSKIPFETKNKIKKIIRK